MPQMASSTADRKAEFNGNGKRKRKPRINKDGVCLAAKRSLAAAQAYLEGRFSTLRGAAEAHGACIRYVEAGVTLLKYQGMSGDPSLTNEVVHSHRSMLEAVAWVEKLVRLVDAYDQAPAVTKANFHLITGTADLSTPEKCLEYGRKVGPGRVWDTMVSPLVGVDSDGQSTTKTIDHDEVVVADHREPAKRVGPAKTWDQSRRWSGLYRNRTTEPGTARA